MTVTNDTITDDSPDYLHVVVTDPVTGHLLDFELIALPLTVDATLRALASLHERHVRRRDADARDEHLPCDNELYAYHVPEDKAVLELSPPRHPDTADDGDGVGEVAVLDDGAIDPPQDREAVARRRRAQIIERLRPIEDLWNVSPFRPEGRGGRGERS